MKKTIVLVLILAGLVGCLWFFYSRRNDQSFGGDPTDFAVKDTAQITKIFLADKQNHTALITRNADGSWWVNKKFQVKKDVIQVLLETLHDMEVKAPVSKSMFNTVVKNLATSSVKVEVYVGDDLEKVFYVGGPNQDHTGSYMLMEGAKRPFLVHIEGFRGYLTPRFITAEKDWKYSGIYDYPYGSLGQIKVTHMEEPSGSFTVMQDLNHFDLIDHKGTSVSEFDTILVSQYAFLYQDIHYLDIPNVEQSFIDSVVGSTPICSIEVTDTLGEKKSIELFHMRAPKDALDDFGKPLQYDLDQMYGYIHKDDQKEFVIVQNWTFDPLTITIDRLLEKSETTGS